MASAEGDDRITMIAKTLLLALLLVVALTGGAQPRWQMVDSTYGPLPSSMHVYRSPDSLGGLPFVAYYVSARLKDRHLQFTAQTGQGKRFTPAEYYQLEQFPLLVVNCTFFSQETGENFSLVVRDGKLIDYNVVSLKGIGDDSLLFYYPTRGAIGIDRNRQADVAWTFTDTARRWPYAFEEMPVVAKGKDTVPSIFSLRDIDWKWWKMRTAVGGGPVLIYDGRIRVTTREEQLYPNSRNDYNPRTAMGYTRDGQLIILAIQGRTPEVAAGATLEQEARILLSLGCYEALNLDGGGSSCMLVNGKETILPSDKGGERPLPAVFLIKRK
jgi:Phosphodiester glycosidase